MPRPTFRDAYLVDHPSGVGYAGTVRRERFVWRIYPLGASLAQQPSEAFATREEAGARLLALSSEG